MLYRQICLRVGFPGDPTCDVSQVSQVQSIPEVLCLISFGILQIIKGSTLCTHFMMSN